MRELAALARSDELYSTIGLALGNNHHTYVVYAIKQGKNNIGEGSSQDELVAEVPAILMSYTSTPTKRNKIRREVFAALRNAHYNNGTNPYSVIGNHYTLYQEQEPTLRISIPQVLEIPEDLSMLVKCIVKPPPSSHLSLLKKSMQSKQSTPRTSSSSTTSAPTQRKFCEECGEKTVSPTAKFCGCCGSKF
jgi:hypothetical protein